MKIPDHLLTFSDWDGVRKALKHIAQKAVTAEDVTVLIQASDVNAITGGGSSGGGRPDDPVDQGGAAQAEAINLRRPRRPIFPE